MRYTYWLSLRGSDNLPFTVSSNNVSKTRLHKVIDFYSKQHIIEQLLVRPYLKGDTCEFFEIC